jgi:DNA-binding response OmpR family regulator
VTLRRSEVQVLAFLLQSQERPAKSSEIALGLYKRRDAAAAQLVRKHVDNLRTKLGGHGWLLESVPSAGYRIAARAWLQDR